MVPPERLGLGPRVACWTGISFFPSSFITSHPAPSHCINKCFGKYLSKKEYKYCTWERMLSLSLPLPPENLPNIAHGPLQPHGAQPGRVFGRSSRDRGPGQPTCPALVTTGSTRAASGLGEAVASQWVSIRNASTKMRRRGATGT